jgi:hypothetical protein
VEAETKAGSGKSVNETLMLRCVWHILFLDFFEHRIVEYGFGMLLSFNNVIIIIIINTYFPEHLSVSAYISLEVGR